MTDQNCDLSAALDERAQSALSSSNYRITLNMHRQNAKLSLEQNLIHSVNGGMFRVNQELIAFISTLLSIGKEDVILLDINDNPIKITNLSEFNETILDSYYEGMNEYLVEMKRLGKSRSPSAIVEEA